jgi:hypothetical protein
VGPAYLAASRSTPRTPYEGTAAPAPISRQARGWGRVPGQELERALAPVRGGRCHRWGVRHASPSTRGCARGRNDLRGRIRSGPLLEGQALSNAARVAQRELDAGSDVRQEAPVPIELQVERMVPKERREQGPARASASRKTQLSVYEGSVERFSRLRGASRAFLRTRKQCHGIRALALSRGLDAGGWPCLQRIACGRAPSRPQRPWVWSAGRWEPAPRLQGQSKVSGWAHQGWRPR